ncbi:flavodoxin family protein [Lachnospiraceae bacterium ZAX-1]
MNILGISFGTKNGTNDTVCKAALMGAKETGAKVEFINTFHLDIKHCTGCCACVKSVLSGRGNLCILKDDFNWLLDKMLDADGIIITDPIFEKGATGLFRTITDRFGPRLDRGNNTIGTQVAAATGGTAPDPRILKDKVISYIAVGGSDWGTRVQCDHAMQALTPMWKVIDNDWFSWSKEFVMNDEKMARAHEIGVSLANAAKDIEHAAYLGEQGVCPHCHSRNFFLSPKNTHAVCCLCGIEGEIEIKNGGFAFTFELEQLSHAHDTLSGKFIHADDIKTMEGNFAKIQQTEEFKTRKKKYNDFISSTTK